MPARRLLPLALALLLAVAGCGGSEPATRQGPAAGEAPTDEAPASVAAYEDFDPSRYPTEPPARRIDIEHTVPARLMASRAAQGVAQTVEGFRVQVFSTQDRRAANRVEEEVRTWWQDAKRNAPDRLFADEIEVVIEYRPPYYRVRVGAFATRDEAEDALGFVQQEFGDAFIARSTVTVVR
jgi:hypothetical protein